MLSINFEYFESSKFPPKKLIKAFSVLKISPGRELAFTFEERDAVDWHQNR